jgi:hypothetical protein
MTESVPLETRGPVAERALLFEFDRRAYGLRLASVDGLAEAGEIRGVAGAPSSVLGLSDWRGRLLTVVDLASLLNEAVPAGGRQDGCLVRLAPPLENTALWIPVAVRLGWVAAEPDAPGAELLHALSLEAPSALERQRPRFIEPVALIRALAAQLES